MYLGQMLLKMSGDIETNPGPNRKRNSTIHIEIQILLLLLIFIVKERKETYFEQPYSYTVKDNINLNHIIFSHKCKLNIIKPTAKYLIIVLLLLSNDIETNPGPIKFNNTPPTIKGKPCPITTKINSPIKLSLKPISSPKFSILNNTKSSKGNMCWGYVSNSLAGTKENPNVTYDYLVYILILLSNDVEANPGPHTNINCANCQMKTTLKNKIECNTCSKIFHKKCVITEDLTAGSKIQWICPEKNCPPNFHINSSQNFISSMNRFTILMNHPNSKNTINNEQDTEERTLPNTEINLLNELPRISHLDYIGNPICNMCNLHIRKNAKPLTCYKCNKKTHMKCAKTIYNKIESNELNKWTCTNCKTNEELITARFDKSNCAEKDMPEEWKQILNNKPKDNDIIIHYNCRSIIKKKEELMETIYKIQPALVFLSETWLDDSCPKGMAVPNNYSIIRKDRSEKFKLKYGKKNGGGIAVLIRKGVKLKIETNAHINDEDEILCCNLITKSSKHLIIFMYRADYTDILKSDKEGNTKMENILQNTASDNMIIIGDLNCDIKAQKPSKETQQLKTLCEDYQLNQQINKPTRITTTSATTIDHIWTRNEDLITAAGTCEGISDHCGIYAFIKENLSKTEPEEITYRDFKNFSEAKYKEDISKYVKESDFQMHLNNKEINKAFDTWLTSIKRAADENAPIITKTKKNESRRIPWYNKELEEITKTKNMYIKLYKLYKNPEDKEAIKRAKNHQTHLKRKCKREYYKERINNFTGDSKKMWNILNDITDRSYKEDILPDVINHETANSFNNYFANVGINVQRKLNINIPKPTLNENGVFEFKPETKTRIEQLINRIKPNVAVGHDQLSAKLIKTATTVISDDLRKLVNLSYEINTFPDQLKIAIVKPIHKKGTNNEPEQYRPISILSVISKIFERSAVDQLMKYAVENNLINPNQHAYQKHHSTVTCLFELVESIKKNIDQEKMVAMAALDLSKAFDSLAHNLILKKLNQLGLNSSSTMWIQSYLTNRKQSVKLKNIQSTQEVVESGVPQGSILGPLLFIITTNDITNALKDYNISIYADDMQILISGTSIEEMQTELETAIKKANNYYNENSLLCNPTKTEIILFGTEQQLKKRNKLQITVQSENETKILTGEKHIKILGVHLDQHLNWNKHISSIKQKATNSIRMLHRINHCLPRKQQRILYNSLVVPYFSYADIIWANCSQKNMKKLQLAQNFAAKSMLGTRKYDSATTALKTLELIPLQQKREIHLAVHVKKALVGNSTENIQNLYLNQLSQDNSRAAIRGDLTYPKHRLKQYSDGTFYSSIKTWNSIPLHLRDNNLNNFKTELQKYFTKQYILA